MLAMFCSVIFRKTSVSMMTAYLVLIVLFALPVAVKLFADVFSPEARQAVARQTREGSAAAILAIPRPGTPGGTAHAPPSTYDWIQRATCTSPLAASFSLPLMRGGLENRAAGGTNWWQHTAAAFLGFYGASMCFCSGRCYGCLICGGG